jgi:maltose O-acetyltransferase
VKWARIALDRVAKWFAEQSFVGSGLRLRILRALGYQIEAMWMGHGVTIVWRNLAIGRESHIGNECYFDGGDRITIEERVWIGPRCVFVTGNHDPADPHNRGGGRIDVEPVRVEAGSWLGAGVLVLPGVTIGHGCVIAAGAVVTKSTRPDGLYAGIPARRVRDLDGEA